MIYASNGGTLQIESMAFAGGRINLATSTGGALTQDIQYYHTDHLGSVRAITNQSGEKWSRMPTTPLAADTPSAIHMPNRSITIA